jgi:hypothetical protein
MSSYKKTYKVYYHLKKALKHSNDERMRDDLKIKIDDLDAKLRGMDVDVDFLGKHFQKTMGRKHREFLENF